MSYVRFSSDNYRSDVYVYSDGTVFNVHIAATRWTGSGSPLLDKGGNFEPIGGPFDGASDTFDTGDEVVRWLHQLAGHGYHIPDGTCESLQGELP